jgi:A/G-specific adenine glycosylase
MVKPSAGTRKPERAGARLLAWWDRERRELPWRAAAGRRPDPYAVWLSEIMLQQTTVAAVCGYYRKFLERWPDVAALAAAPLEEVLAAWAGLGYYARARNLHACAVLVAGELRGRFPETSAELRGLPGVGPYTAAAIAAIAFDEPCVAQDGNVERVMARLHALQRPLPGAKAEIGRLAAQMLTPERPGDFAQALMDLGATICAPRAPDCARCPLSDSCKARRLGAPQDYPRKAPKSAKPHRRGAAFVLRRGDAVQLAPRPAKGLLGGMRAFPTTPLHEDVIESAQARHAPAPARWRRLEGEVRHVFTHFTLELAVFVAEADAAQGDGWTRIDALGDAGLPTLMRKVAIHAGLIRA